MPLVAGARLGPYEIIGLVGVGGMGEVYRGRDTRLDRTVAVKVLVAHLADAPESRQRFEREARTISAVEDSHICALYDVGTEGGIDFLVMQFVEGETLADRIARDPIAISEALEIARGVAAGLDAAHERGILHRDLKPANIKLTPDGGVKILDFGLAKALIAAVHTGASGQTGPQTFTPGATEAGTILGTASYMSPEQARGKAVDKRTDIWAFGCVLFEMLARRSPFAGDSLPDVLAAVVGRDPDWSALPADLPRRLRELLQRCLQKDPAHRLRDIGDARLELEAAKTAEPPALAAHKGSRRWPLVLGWGVAAAAVLVAAGSMAALMRSRARPPTRAAMRFTTVTNFSGVEAQPSLSPDGRSVAFVSNRDGRWDIYIGLVTGSTPIRITNDASVESRPSWSPDGAQLLFARLNDHGLNDVWVVPALGGTARRVVENASHPAWSLDGRSIAYSSGGAITIAEANGANPRAVTQPEGFRADYSPRFSHDGRSLAFIRRRAAAFGAPYGALAVLDLASRRVQFLTKDDSQALSPVWSPDDRFVYFTSSREGALNVWKIPAASGEPEQITIGQGDDTDIDLSADGRRMVFSSFRANVNLAEVSLERQSPGRRKWLTSDAGRAETAPRYSPDGRRIAYFSNRSGGERESIWVMDADGANANRIVADAGRSNVFPHWTGDGQELVYMSRTSSVPVGLSSLVDIAELRRVPLAGGAPQSLPVRPWSPAWGDVASDGRIIYRTSSNTGEVFDPRTNRRQPIANLLGDPVWSRDGQTFAYHVRPGVGKPADAGLWLQTAAGNRQQLFRGWVVWFAWSGHDLVFIEGTPDLKSVLWRIDALGEKKLALLEGLPMFMRHTDIAVPVRFDIHPDGGRIVIEALESFESDIGLMSTEGAP